MPNSSNQAKFISYADDTAMFITATTETELELQGHRTLREFKQWADANYLRINSSKTKVVVYMQKGKQLRSSIKMKMGTDDLEIVNTVSTLGVTFSKDLSWNDHVEQFSKKLSSAVGTIARMKYFLPTKIKILLYNALVFSILQYCNLVWGTTTKTNLMKLHLLQKRAVRSIANVPSSFSTKDLFVKFDILPVFFPYDYRLILAYKSHLKSNNSTVFSLADLNVNRSIRYTRHKEKWHVPTPRSNHDKQSLTRTVPILLNKLAKEEFDPLRNSNHAIRIFCQSYHRDG